MQSTPKLPHLDNAASERAPTNFTRSTILHEKPHSLSYQDTTLAKFPSSTMVDAASTIEERGFPVKSTETSFLVSYPRIPFMGPFAALSNARLISSAVAFFASSTERSTTDTSGVGTRMAYPFNFPSRSGITFPMALAAPVELGMIDCAAARARRRSLWGKSRIFWSLVYE